MMEKILCLTVIVVMLVAGSAQAIIISDSLLVDLNAADLVPGELTTWQNNGTLGGSYEQYGMDTVPTVETVGIAQAVTFEAGDVLVSTFNAPAGITGTSDWTVEAWVYNPDIQWQETLFSWHRRGGITQSASVNYGVGWGGAVNHLNAHYGDFAGNVPPAAWSWHYLAFSYTGSSGDMIERVYVDGVLNTSFDLSVAPLDLGAGDFTSIGTVYESGEGWVWDGTQWIWGTVEGWMVNYLSGSIGALRVHDGALSADDVAANYSEELPAYEIQVADLILIEQTNGSTTVSEQGTTSDQFTISIASETPLGEVYMTLEDKADPDQVKIVPDSLFFTPSNSEEPQTITVTAIDDDILEANPHTTTISITVFSEDPVFNGPGGDIEVPISDNDWPTGTNKLPPPLSPSFALMCSTCEDEDGVSVGDPIYPFSGECYKTVTDMSIPGRGLDFIWARKYRSKMGPNTEQGNGWDFSYNIRIEKDGNDLILFNGNTRQDRFILQPDGSWAADGFCWEFIQDANDVDSSVTMMCSDTGKWHFRRFDNPCAPGRINTISDRNGNTLTFEYDEKCRLVTVHDTLDTKMHNRDITIAYNADGFIESVTDFIGRQVRYEYYQDGDAGGSSGDLKSVTTPAVTGTPTGNDFPLGKTTVYTYSKGFTDERLNHNLLTITDPSGQTYMKNIYATTQDRNDFNFDRVVRQIWGNTDDIIDITYVPQIPSAQNDFAFTRTIVNDRVGNVKEYFHDSLNQLILQKDYTGQADPDQPTTETQNRPIGKLRPDDPNFFETRWHYNADYLPVLIQYPNRNFTFNVYELDIDPNAPRLSRCNLREIHYLPGPLEPISDQNEIVEYFEYDSSMGGCCGSNFVTRHVDGRGNETIHEYDDRGNRLRTVHRIPGIVEKWEYNEFGQVVKHTLPDNGSGHRRVDINTYYSNSLIADLDGDNCVNLLDLAIMAQHWFLDGDVADIYPPGDNKVDHKDLKVLASMWLECLDLNISNPQNGYLKSAITDATNLVLTTTYEYDAVGNTTSVTDPRGHNAQYIHNQLNQVIRTISRPVTDSSGVRYEKDTYYDNDDNVVRTDIQNIDDQGVLQANTHFTTIYEYETLNYLIRQSKEVGSYTGAIPGPTESPSTAGLPESEFITTEYEYDDNRNRTLVRSGEATEGRQATNVVRTLFDERDMVFKQIRAEGDPDQSTTQYDYDGNGNLKKILEGLEDYPRITSSIHDGYDRLVASTNPMGNVTSYHYDENDNKVSYRVDGELNDVPGGAANVRLSETTYTYDVEDRPTRSEVAFFDSNSKPQKPIDDGLSVTETRYSDTSQVIRVTNDNNHAVDTTYDTANRKLTITDAKGNTLTYNYDDNSNVVSAITVEKSDLGNLDQAFTAAFTYDGLDRLIQTVDNVGNDNTSAYDSRNNRTRMTDALTNETRYAYDGLNRLTQIIRDLDGDGADGNGADISTGQTWDDNSRLISLTDDNGNTTSYAYDALNRLTRTTYADGTQNSSTYDVHGNEKQTRDTNGSTSICDYDLLNRILGKTIVPGAGVSNDTTFESYTYDGLSRLIHAEDNDSVVNRNYDSLSRVTRETLNGQTTSCLYDGVINKVSCIYPGGRVITNTYDELERKKTISDVGGTIAKYDYVGPRRVERREHGNGTRTDYTYDGITGIPNPTGDFGVKRIIETKHTRIADGTVIDDRAYTWNKVYNKTQRKDMRIAGTQLTHDYTYDDIYRLVHTTVTDNIPAVVRDINYDLDGVGNRTTVTGSPDPGIYTMVATTPEPSDDQMNQYTTTSFDSRLYDKAGNLITIDNSLPMQKVVTYDYRNQMVEVNDVNRGQVHTYMYDVLGRRIARTVDAYGTPQETRYLYDGWQVVEEQNDSGTTQATYVYGNYIDEVLNMHRGGNDYYCHADDLLNVMAVTDSTGAAVERYEYADYGEPYFFDAAGSVIAGTAIGNPYLFTGRRHDPETGWYYYRTRYLDPAAGRFTTRDMIGIWGDSGNIGNGYTYAASNPSTLVDPAGLKTRSKHSDVIGSSSNFFAKFLYDKVEETCKEGGDAFMENVRFAPGGSPIDRTIPFFEEWPDWMSLGFGPLTIFTLRSRTESITFRSSGTYLEPCHEKDPRWKRKVHTYKVTGTEIWNINMIFGRSIQKPIRFTESSYIELRGPCCCTEKADQYYSKWPPAKPWRTAAEPPPETKNYSDWPSVLPSSSGSSNLSTNR